jgi:integrase
MRLTTKTVAALTLPPGKQDHIEFDDAVPGFGIRLRASGSRTWLFQYRIGAKQRRMALGSVSAIPVGAARETAGKLHAKVKLGEDPATDKANAISQASETFEAVAKQYLTARKPALREQSFSAVERHLMLHAKSLHRLPLTAVSQRNISDVLRDIANGSGDVASNRVRASLAAFFSWAIREGFRLPEGNPAANTNKREERTRERVLKPEELRTIWNACQDDDYGNIIKLLMLTGQRASEISELRWSEVQNDQIVLPAARTKNNRVHVVPMSEPVRAMLAPLRSDSVCVFGRFGTGFDGWSRSKRTLEARFAEPLPHWVPHDLRRTVATGMADLGVQPHIIEAVLNHVSGHKAGVAGIYNRSTYDREKREALNLWAEHLMAVVVPLSGSGKPNTDRILRLYQAMMRTAAVVPLKRGA